MALHRPRLLLSLTLTLAAASGAAGELEPDLLPAIEQARARVIPRPQTASGAPKNGYACLAELATIAPKRWGPFAPEDGAAGRARDLLSQSLSLNGRGLAWKANADKVPKVAKLAERVRGCGKSAQLQLVATVEPWRCRLGEGCEDMFALEAMANVTAIEVGQARAARRPARALELATGALAVLFDAATLEVPRLHLAAEDLDTHAATLVASLDALPAPDRKAWAPVFAALAARLPDRASLVESTRLATAVEAWGGHLSQKARAVLGTPKADGKASLPLWAEWSARCQQLAKVSDAEVEPAAQALADWESEQGLFSGLSKATFAELAKMHLILRVLQDLAKGIAQPEGTVVKFGKLALPMGTWMGTEMFFYLRELE